MSTSVRLRAVSSSVEPLEPTRHALRVLFLNYEYPPMGGGAGNATRHTAMELCRRGHTAHVITSRLAEQSDVETDDRLVVYRVYSRRRSIHEAGLTGALTYLAGALIKLRQLTRVNDYDVFHFYFGLPTGLLALYVHFVLRKPYIIALRGSDVPGYDNTRWYLRPLHRLASPLTRFIWRNALSVTALSGSLKALAESSVPGVPIRIIGNGIDPAMFPQKREGSRIDKIRLICVCRLVRRKGLEYLLNALPALRDTGIQLDLIGTGECHRRIERMVNSLGVQDCVNVVGYVPRERLADYYTRADVFVLPSLSESFGQVLLEAMSSGLPVVASRVGGIPETLDHGKGGLLIEPASSEAIAGAVRRLAKEPSLRQTMGNYNRQKAVRQYGWGRIAAQYENLYLSALARDIRSVATAST